MRTWGWVVFVVALVLGLSAHALAGKGGNKGGGGGGGGGSGDPPANPEIAYVDLAGNGDGLVVMNADGSNKTVIVPVDAAEPSWSPDGQRLVFRGGWGITTTALYVVNVDGTGLRELVPGWAVDPVWSPQPAADGQYKIAFMRGGDIWLINPDGTGEQRLTNTPDTAENHPTWGPAAARIAVRCIQRDPATGVWLTEGVRILHLDVGTETAIDVSSYEDVITLPHEEHVENFRNPDWARTKDKLVYSRHRTDRTVSEDNSDLYVLDLAAPGTPFLLTPAPTASEWRPTWSPDDSKILFRQNTGRKRDTGLYVLNADGSGLTNLGIKDGAWADWLR